VNSIVISRGIIWSNSSQIIFCKTVSAASWSSDHHTMLQHIKLSHKIFSCTVEGIFSSVMVL